MWRGFDEIRLACLSWPLMHPTSGLSVSGREPEMPGESVGGTEMASNLMASQLRSLPAGRLV